MISFDVDSLRLFVVQHTTLFVILTLKL